MKRWEAYTVRAPLTEIGRMCDRLGAEGWEPVSAWPTTPPAGHAESAADPWVAAMLKRRVRP